MNDRTPSVEELTTLLKEHKALLAAQQQRIDRLEAKLADSPGPTSGPVSRAGAAGTRHISRGSLLKLAALGAAATTLAAGGDLLGGSPVAHADGTEGQTLFQSELSPVISILPGDPSGIGLEMIAPPGDAPPYINIYTKCEGGRAIAAIAGAGGTAVEADTGTGTAVLASAIDTGGDAVNASAVGGRGVIASGAVAPLRLVPSSTRSHPKSGLAGDFFVDKFNRLWYCTKGGSVATWRRVRLV